MQIKTGMRIEDIEIGMSVSYSQTISAADVKQFADVSGDHNPIHLDESYASESRYKRRIAHGLLSGSFSRGYLELNCLGLDVSILLNHSILKGRSISEIL